MQKITAILFGLSLLLPLASFAAAPTVAYYRFETGPAGAPATSIVDSSGNGLNGSILTGAPTYNADVPVTTVPQTGDADNFSMNFGATDSASFNYPFPFNTNTNATLEFWIHPNGSGDGDFLWTTTAGGDANRFNIHWAPNEVFADYREPGGPGHEVGHTGVGTVPAGEWSFVAIVKQGNTYTMYVNSSATGNVTTVGSTQTDVSPNLPNSTGWTINGRCAVEPNCGNQFEGLLDEVRLSDQALSPSQFLVSSRHPTDKDQCKNGGYLNFVDDNSQPFQNQGQCVSYVNSH